MNSSGYTLQQSTRPDAWSAWMDSSGRTNNSFLMTRQIYNPYRTLQYGCEQNGNGKSLPMRQVLKKIEKSPFSRIKRVEQMIKAQKIGSKTDTKEGPPFQSQVLKPHFKIKNKKNKTIKDETNSINEDGKLVINKTLVKAFDAQIANSLGNKYKRPESLYQTTHNVFQQNFKNRCRLNRKSPRKPKEASLLERLNCISDNVSLQRYQSKAGNYSQKVTPFFSLY